MRRIAVQILLSYLPLVTLTAAIGLYAAVLLASLGGTVGRVLAENYRSVLAAERMIRAVDLQEVARVSGDEQAFQAAGTAFESALADAFGGAFQPGEPALLDSMATLHETYTGARREAPSVPPAAVAAQLQGLAGRLLQINQTAILDKNERAERAAEGARRSLAVAVGLAVLLSIVVGTQFSRRISRPIGQLQAAVEDVAQGRFGRRVTLAAGGEVGALAVAFNAMTQRLQAFEALNVQAMLREKRTTESLVEAIPSPVVVTDEAGHLHLFNHAAEAFLVGGGQPLGRPLAAVAPTLHAALEAAVPRPDGGRLAEVPGNGASRTYQLRQTHVHVPGSEGHATAEAGADDAPGVRLTVSLLEDVTPLQAQDRARREFLAAVSHELRTPLTSLGIALDLLLRQYVGPLAEEQRDLLSTAKADTDRLKALVARLLDLARLDAAGLRRAPVVLASVVEAAVAGVALAAAERGVRLDVHVAPDLPPLSGDAEALRWAVSNLAVNAVRHARTRVGVRAARARLTDGGPDGVRLVVEDDGPGLPPDAEQRVFEPLVQLESFGGGAPRLGSAGLGLTIVRRVAEAHAGLAYAEAGPGGRFFIWLPLSPLPPP